MSGTVRPTFDAKSYVDRILDSGAELAAFTRDDGSESFSITKIRNIRQWPAAPTRAQVPAVVAELKSRGLFIDGKAKATG